MLFSSTRMSDAQYAALYMREHYGLPITKHWTNYQPQTKEAAVFFNYKDNTTYNYLLSEECFSDFNINKKYNFYTPKKTMPPHSSIVLPIPIAISALQKPEEGFNITSILIRKEDKDIHLLLDHREQEENYAQAIDDLFDAELELEDTDETRFGVGLRAVITTLQKTMGLHFLKEYRE